MKKLLLTFSFAIAIGVGCTERSDAPKKVWHVIISKSYLTYYNNPLPKGICRFLYTKDGIFEEFQDSCHFYKIGDTLKF